MHQFLSRRSNKRVDLYGGDIENRARFLTNTIRKIRETVGPDKPLGARFSGAELMPEGVTVEEAQQFVKMAVEAGCNFINISQGCYENPGAFAPDGENEFTQYGAGFKKAAGNGIPVISPGFITPGCAEKALVNNDLDVISLGRQAIADPYWPVKVKSDLEKEIVKCTRCNHCYMNLFESKWLTCSVNPTAGFEQHYPALWQNEKKAKKFISKLDAFV
jgi:2,4-dienoyl-CoA reductase-like NADH-dependent reductase (Old Yellow Enzyme family)